MLTQRSKLPERRPRTSAAPGARRVGRDFNLNAVIGAYLGAERFSMSSRFLAAVNAAGHREPPLWAIVK
jgi:hypothetical protein